MDKINEYQKLLNSVSAIAKKYEEIAKISGENYNVFNVLGLSTREVRTHSAFIADLLNPDGLHGQGSVFLDLFVDQLKEIKEIEFVSVDAKVFVEEYIGKIDEDEGGRIDIVIKDNSKNQIVIENKIYAKDQYKQLVRYHEKYPKALLLYLTLYEKGASAESITKENGTKLEKDKDYFNITYKKDVLKWLLNCKKEAVSQPLLRETISQYINLIKQLTGQTMSDKMNDEIKNTLRKELINNNNNNNNKIENFKKLQEYINYSKVIASNLEVIKMELRNELRSDFFIKLYNEKLKKDWIPVRFVDQSAEIDKDVHHPNFGFKYNKQFNNNGIDFNLSIEIKEDKNWWKSFICGVFVDNDIKQKEMVEKIFSENNIKYMSDNYWVYLHLGEYIYKGNNIAWNVYDDQWNNLFVNEMDQIIEMYNDKINMMIKTFEK